MDLLRQYPYLCDVQQEARREKLVIFLVGGFLRDFYLGRLSTDFDFAVSKDAIKFAKAFARRIKGAFVLLDQAHGAARVVKNQGDIAYTFDFSDFRGKTIKDDLVLRDFTVNSFCLDLSRLAAGKDFESAIMPYAQGVKDLKQKKVRMVSVRAFSDDPLRLLRAFSLSATWGMRIEPKTLAQIKKDKHLIGKPAKERVREELYKILASDNTAGTLQQMDELGILELVIPQLAIMHGVGQGGYHHLDVWKHSLEVLAQLENILQQARQDKRQAAYLQGEIGGNHRRFALLKLAALLHDIGKPQTKKKEKDRFTFHGHENVGKAITRIIAKQLRFSQRERYFLEDMVQMHLRPGYLSNFKQPSSKAVFRYMRDAKEEGASLAFLALADQAATCGPKTTKEKHAHHAKICRMIIEKFFEVKALPPMKERLLTGDDLIKKLKLKPSPLFTKILTAVEEAQALKKITTKEEALALARKLT